MGLVRNGLTSSFVEVVQQTVLDAWKVIARVMQ